MQPPAKGFKNLKRVSRLLDEDDEQEHEQDSREQISKEKQQLISYIEYNITKEEKKLSSFEFWLMKQNA